ncbi:MAG TPA: hypothetical protein V6D50_17635 [Chroococcales cyanobacterium]
MRHPLARFLTPTLLDEVSVFLDSSQIILSPSEIHPSLWIPPSWRVDLDFWTVMGEWMSIYFETADAMSSEQ